MVNTVPGARRSVGLAIVLCALGGTLASVVNIPLPWMVGSMLAMAAARLRRLSISAPSGGRQLGQMIIGITIGLSFTPEVMSQVADLAGLMLFAGCSAIFIAYLSGIVLARLARVDCKTAFFSCVPGGAAEIVLLAQRYEANVAFVAMSQSLRMMLVVLVVPPLLTFGTGAVLSGYSTMVADVYWPGLFLLFAINAFAAVVCRNLSVPTPWMLAPLLFTALLAANGYGVSAMPDTVSSMGQALIGCAIGAQLNRDFLVAAPRYVMAMLFSVLIILLLSAGLGAMLSAVSDLPLSSMVLATAPGGIAEMSITAKVLNFGVPVITAFHVCRLMVLLVATSPVFRVFAFLRQRAG